MNWWRAISSAPIDQIGEAPKDQIDQSVGHGERVLEGPSIRALDTAFDGYDRNFSVALISMATMISNWHAEGERPWPR